MLSEQLSPEELARNEQTIRDCTTVIDISSAGLQDRNPASGIVPEMAKITAETEWKTSTALQNVGGADSDSLEDEQQSVELISDAAITLAIEAAKKVYGNRFEYKALPSTPSTERVLAAFASDAQQAEIGGRTEPTLRFMIVEDGDTLCYQPIILDGAQEMPLEAYEGKDVERMTREERVLASRELNANPDCRKELDHEDMTVYDLLSHGAAMQGQPIDQATWTLLTVKFKKGDRFAWFAVWDGGRSDRGEDLADSANQGDRLRFAVWGDVIH